MTGTRAVIAAVALLLGLSACSGEDPQPKVAPPSPTSPSTTGTSAEAPPEMPDAAKGTDAAAAEAFVEFYWDAVAYAQRTGDLSALREISSAKCIACQAGIDALAEIFADGGKIRGGISRVVDASTAFVEEGDALDAVVDFKLETSRQRIEYSGHQEDVVYRGGTSNVRARLEPTDAGWIMLFWDET